MEPEEDTAALAAQELIVSYSRMRRRIREFASDLTPSQTSVLSRLSKEGESSLSLLAQAERVRPQSMAATLSALDERGLIARRPDPDDGRRQLINLSGTGENYVRDYRKARDEWLARMLREHATEAEIADLREALLLIERITRV
ncbi:MarR family transcriptional regulator [Kineosporia sp. NBRC 101731]|uniref:MarR family winged helix-turn-helix transcriptional regulator n=1 Tax=Kineosporia sp. NBRC 101731 TaxID=3032199 RepID=UPI0024A42E62|nr:MarR family transcriptional regulator [Kineosporia sp. NBRC 101731]GLY27038.1 MarR family transcriptional regulator [Kineosporia sp. NBRC 101731]